MSTAPPVPSSGSAPTPALGRLAAIRRGRVAEFSPERGLGVVEEAGGARFSFHCVEIADGSRRIAVGVRVVFSLRPCHDGTLEARQLVAETS